MPSEKASTAQNIEFTKNYAPSHPHHNYIHTYINHPPPQQKHTPTLPPQHHIFLKFSQCFLSPLDIPLPFIVIYTLHYSIFNFNTYIPI
jgi:hypothetical protein